MKYGRAGAVAVWVAGWSAGAWAQHLDYEWALGIGGIESDSARATVDAFGDVQVTGYFNDIVDFDPSGGEFELIGLGASRYIAKYDAAGAFVYAVAIGTNTAAIEFVNDIAADGAGGVYRTGIFSNTVDFDPGMGSAPQTCDGAACGYVLHLDEFGEYVSAHTFGAPGATVSVANVEVLASGDIVLAGQFRGTVDFDPGAGAFPLSSQATGSQSDVFVVRLTAAGAFVFARAFGGVGANAAATALTSDAAGAVYVAGEFAGTVDFDPGAGEANRNAATLAGYVAKLDASGDFVFAETNVGTGTCNPRFVAVAGTGDVFLGGFFEDEIDFDPGAGSDLRSSVAGSTDGYIQKLNATGGFEFVHTFGGPRFDQMLNGTVDPNDNLFAAGIFEDAMDADPGPGERLLSSDTEEETGVLLVLNSLGEFVSAETVEGDDEVGIIGGVALGVNGTAVISGQFRGRMDDDPVTNVDGPLSTGDVDGFVIALTPNRRIYRTPSLNFVPEGERIEMFAPIGGNYQWIKDGVDLADDPPRVTGATTNRLTIESALASDSGVYRARYDNGAKAVVLSDPHTLTVVPEGALPVGGVWWLTVGVVLLMGLGCLVKYRRQSLPHT